LTEEVLGEFGALVEEWTLVPASGGLFEVEVDGELVYSKKATGRHATLAEVRTAFRARSGD
jgi:selenoprotein W-related protein